jgi:hypothetical protein
MPISMGRTAKNASKKWSVLVGRPAFILARARQLPAMMTVTGVAPAAVTADIPAAVKAAVAMPAMMASVEAAMAVPVTAPDLDQVRLDPKMFGEGGSRSRGAGGRKRKYGGGDPSNSM